MTFILEDTQNRLSDALWDQMQAQERGLKQEEPKIKEEMERLEQLEQDNMQQLMGGITTGVSKYAKEIEELEQENSQLQAIGKDQTRKKYHRRKCFE